LPSRQLAACRAVGDSADIRRAGTGKNQIVLCIAGHFFSPGSEIVDRFDTADDGETFRKTH